MKHTSASSPPSDGFNVRQHGGVAAKHPVLSADPQIAWPRDRIGRWLGSLVGVFILLRRAVEQAIQFSLVETEQSEVDILIAERSQFGRQHLVVPSGVVGDPVVGDHQRAALRGRKVRKNDDRRFREAKLARREHTPMSRNDHAIIADQHGVHETKLRDRASDLRDLGLGMRPGIARMRDQPVERPMLEARRKRGCHVDYGVLRWVLSLGTARCASPSKGNVL